MNRLFVCFVLLFCADVASAQSSLSLKGDGVKVVKVDKVIVVKEDMTVVQSFPVTITAPPDADLYFWSYPSGITALDKNDSLEIKQAPKGLLTVSVKMYSVNLDKDGKFKGFITKLHSLTFTVGDVPPGPGPGPDPKPDPKPDPVIPPPLPIPAVLFIEETNDRAKISTGQYDSMFSKEMNDFISANVTKEDGIPALRLLDKDQATGSMAKHWRDAAAKRPSNFTTPWMIVSNGVTGWEGPVPNTMTETKALLTKYLVNKGK